MSEIESGSSFWAKIKKDPLPVIGITGFFGIVGYSLYSYKNKSASTKASVYVIHTRLAAQGFAVGALTASLLVHMYKEYRSKHPASK